MFMYTKELTYNELFITITKSGYDTNTYPGCSPCYYYVQIHTYFK